MKKLFRKIRRRLKLFNAIDFEHALANTGSATDRDDFIHKLKHQLFWFRE